jgi:hypothetical protein
MSTVEWENRIGYAGLPFVFVKCSRCGCTKVERPRIGMFFRHCGEQREEIPESVVQKYEEHRAAFRDTSKNNDKFRVRHI